MAATTTAGLPFTDTVSTGSATRIRFHRRHISPQAGHALEILGHAIEYLTDEFVHEGGSYSSNDGRLQAVQLLMAVNRGIYFDCPVVPTIWERFRTMLGIRTS